MLAKKLTEIKYENQTIWLSKCHSSILLNALDNLDIAFKFFFKGYNNYPQFKKKSNRQSIRYSGEIKINENKAFLPKIGWIKFNKSRNIEGKTLNFTVSKTPTNKYYISIQCEITTDEAKKERIRKETAVGIDLGIKSFAVTSDGEIFENQKYLHKNLRRLRVEQRKLQRCKKGSKRREKQRLVVAKLYEKITNQRNDYLHKLSTSLVENYGTICVEDLNVQGMLSNKSLALSIGELGFNSFVRMLEYKCEWRGKNFIKIGRFEPSSKRCHNCGYINHNLTLKDREWICPECGAVIDRDYNAALNIRDYGLGVQPSDAKTA